MERPIFKLESESSSPSNEDNESVYSFQDKDTDFVKDTTDTDFELEIEYEVDSYSEHDSNSLVDSSDDTEVKRDMMLAAVAICDTTFENWVTDCEESDNSSTEDYSFTRTDFWTCIKCKSMKKDPLYRFCEKCFQDRKTFFPPRPKPKRRKVEAPVKLDTLRSCLSGLSHDSGIGSSQECPPLDLDQIVVPPHLTSSSPSSPSSVVEGAVPEKTGDSQISTIANRKRQLSESSLSDLSEIEAKRPRREKSKSPSKEIVAKLPENLSDSGLLQEAGKKDMCTFCNVTQQNAIFLHGSIAHMCCCYKCAMRTWRTIKRCPICNRKVNNVVKVFKN